MNKLSCRGLITAAIITAVISAASFVYAGGPMMGGMPALSPEQQTKAQKLNNDFFAATNALRQQIMSKQAEINAQMFSLTPDAGKIEALSKELGGLEGKLRVEVIKLNAALTKEGIPTTGPGMGMTGDGMTHGGMMHGGMMGGGMMHGGMMGGGMMGAKNGTCPMMGGMGSMRQNPDGAAAPMQHEHMMGNMGSMQNPDGSAAPMQHGQMK